MNQRRSVRLTCVLFAAMGIACQGPDDELAWDVEATRGVVLSPGDVPRVDSAGGEYHVVVPLGLQRFRITLGAERSLHVGRGAKILAFGFPPPTQPYGFVSSMGRTLVDGDSEVGSVYSYGGTPLRIAAGAKVHGYVKACAPVEISRRARVEVGVQENAQAMAEVFGWRVAPAAHNLGDRTSPPGGEPLDLEPGAYAKVRVGPGSTLRLRRGRYQFDALDVEHGGRLETNNTLGPVYVWIHQSLSLSGSMYAYSREPNVLFGYSGGSAPVIRTPFHGTLVAPDATVSIPATHSPHRGAFFAGAIEVADRATIEHASFWLRHVPPAEPARVCAQCAEVTRLAAQECCASLYHSMATGQRAASTCARLCASIAGRPVDSCRMQCERQSSRATARLDAEAKDCLRNALGSFSDCLVSQSYNPDTCSKLGYATGVTASCTGP